MIIPMCIFVQTTCNAQELTLDEEMWNNDKTQTVKISKSAFANNYVLIGEMRYVADSENGVFAVNFEISETTLTDERHNVFIIFTISENDSDYTLRFNENGVVQNDSCADKFQVKTQCVYDEQGVFNATAIIEFSNTKVEHGIDISIYINDHRYLITDNNTISTITVDSKPTTTKSKSSTQTTTKTTTTKNSETNSESSKRSTTKTTTKYSPSESYQSDTTEAYQLVDYAYAAEDSSAVYDIPSASQDDKGSMSTTAKVIAVTGSAVCMVGATFIVFGAINHSKSKIDIPTKDE